MPSRLQSFSRSFIRGLLMRPLEWILLHPHWTLLLIALLTIGFGFQIPKLVFSTSVHDMVIEDSLEQRQYAKFKEQFGSEAFIRVVVTTSDLFDPITFQAIAHLSDAAAALPGVQRVISLPEIKKRVDIAGPWPLDRFARLICSLPVFRQNVISEDQRTTAINVVLGPEANSQSVIDGLRAQMDAMGDAASLYQIGVPLVNQALATMTRKDFILLPPITFLLAGLALLAMFRNWRYVLLPIVTVSAALVWTFGLMSLTGIHLSLITLIVPVFLIAVGTAYCLHIGSTHLRLATSATHRVDVTKQTIGQSAFPLTLAVVTTGIGLGALWFNSIDAIYKFAIFASLGMASLQLMMFTLTPALLMCIPVPVVEKKKRICPQRWLDRFAQFIVVINTRHRSKVLMGMLLVAVFCFLGLMRLKIETNPVEYFKEDTPIVRRIHAIEQQLSGCFPVYVTMEGPTEDYYKEPLHLQHVAHLQAHGESQPGIDKGVSIVDYLKLVNYAGNQYSSEHYTLPDSAWETGPLVQNGKILLGADLIRSVVDEDLRTASILFFTRLSSSNDYLAFQRAIGAYARHHLPDDLSVQVTGFGMVASASNHQLTIGQAQSLVLTLMVVFIVMFSLFLSAKVGLIAIVPNVFPILVNFGLMGWFNVPLSTVTSLIASIAIGLAVDDTIHYLVHFNREFKKDLDKERAMRKTIAHLVRPIVFTSLSIGIGFSVLMFSSFKPTAVFGAMMVITMISAMVADLILLPGLMLPVELVTLWDLLRIKLGREPRLGIPLFSGLSRAQVHYTLLAGVLKTVPKGQLLFKKGESSDLMYAIISGRLRAIDYREDGEQNGIGASSKFVSMIASGDVVGEMGFLRQAPRSLTVEALEDTELLEISWRMIKRLQMLYMFAGRIFFRNLMGILCNRLEKATHRLTEETEKDDFTGLCTIPYFEKRLQKEVLRSQRYPADLTLCMLRIHFPFRSSRDEDTIEAIFRSACPQLTCGIRDCDILCRIDASTFGLLLPNTRLDDAHRTCLRLQQMLQRYVSTHTTASFQVFSAASSMHANHLDDAPQWMAQLQAQLKAAMNAAPLSASTFIHRKN